MPHYFLHIHDGETFIEDCEGKDYPDVAAAVGEAEEAARELLADRLIRGMELDGQRIDVTDVEGTVVGVVKFADQVRTPSKAAE